MKSRFVPVGLVLSVLFFSQTASVCLGADYATDKGSNMFAITAGFVSAGGDLYEDDQGNSSTTLLIMPGMARFISTNFGLGGDLLILNSKQGDTGLSTLGLGPKMMNFFGGPGSKTYPYHHFGHKIQVRRRGKHNGRRSSWSIDGSVLQSGQSETRGWKEI